MFKNWKHWEYRIGRWTIFRWCEGAPCGLLPDGAKGRHAVRAIRRRW